MDENKNANFGEFGCFMGAAIIITLLIILFYEHVTIIIH